MPKYIDADKLINDLSKVQVIDTEFHRGLMKAISIINSQPIVNIKDMLNHTQNLDHKSDMEE